MFTAKCSAAGCGNEIGQRERHLVIDDLVLCGRCIRALPLAFLDTMRWQLVMEELAEVEAKAKADQEAALAEAKAAAEKLVADQVERQRLLDEAREHKAKVLAEAKAEADKRIAEMRKRLEDHRAAITARIEKKAEHAAADAAKESPAS